MELNVTQKTKYKLNDVTLSSKAYSFADAEVNYHNGISKREWLRSDRVDALQKTLVRLAEVYCSEDNKDVDPTKRIYYQNTTLGQYKDKSGDVYLDINTRNVQKMLKRMLEMGIIEKFIFVSQDGYEYEWTGGTYQKWQEEFLGLTKRYIVLNINKLKEYFTITTNTKEYDQMEKRSAARRLIRRRLFSIAKTTNKELTATQVKDLNVKKKTMNKYLLLQLRTFGKFDGESTTIAVDKDALKAEFDNMVAYIYDAEMPPGSELN